MIIWMKMNRCPLEFIASKKKKSFLLNISQQMEILFKIYGIRS